MKHASVLAVLFVAAVLFLFLRSEEPEAGLRFGDRSDLPLLVFYSTPAATTPQLPFWAGIRSGKILDLFRIELRLWRDMEQLQGLLLAGKGDLWLGHTDGFARAYRRGAPVRLLVVSGWRKFHLLSRPDGPSSFEDLGGRTLAYAPQGSPAVPLLHSLLSGRLPPIEFAPHQPAQLAHLLRQGALDSALVPEPLASTLLLQDPSLRIAASLEDLYGRLTHGPSRFPLAGLAVNATTARRFPDRISRLLEILVEEGKALASDPARGLRDLPETCSGSLPAEVLAASLARDPILALPATEVAGEIEAYLGRVAPEAAGVTSGEGGEDFLWR